jgi:uncharacterized protein (DUF2336 family)
MPGSLSNDDVARLLSDASAGARAELAGKLGQEITEAGLAQGELAIAQDIVRLLARDVAVTVRSALANSPAMHRTCRAMSRCAWPTTWSPSPCRS